MGITAEDVEKNPEFMKLLNSLSRHIGEDGMSTNTSQDLKKVRSSECNSRLSENVLFVRAEY